MARADRFTQTDKKNIIYSDFLTDFNTHPVSGDIVRFTNENAVIRAIKNLLETDKGERHYEPNIGSNIRKMLFEPMGTSTASEIATLVKETIENYEPRAKIIDIKSVADYDNNRYFLEIVIMVINTKAPVSFSVSLSRVR